MCSFSEGFLFFSILEFEKKMLFHYCLTFLCCCFLRSLMLIKFSCPYKIFNLCIEAVKIPLKSNSFTRISIEVYHWVSFHCIQ